MNDLQRQILADRLDEVIRDIDKAREVISNLERRLLSKKAEYARLCFEKEQLEQGVDW